MAGDHRGTRVAGPAPADAKCGECGARIPSGARFCAMCGAAYQFAIPTTKAGPSIGFREGFTFGLGFSIAGAIVGLIGALLYLLVIASLLSGIVNAFRGTTGAMTFSGTGDRFSDPFRLTGNVDVEWSAAPSGGPCSHAASIYLETRPVAREVIVERDLMAEESGTHTLRGLANGRYVITVESDCNWSFRLVPRS